MWNGTWNSDKTTGMKWDAIDWRISTKNKTGFTSLHMLGRHSGVMVSALISGYSGLGSRRGPCQEIVFLDKSLHFQNSSLQPGV